MFSKHGPRPPAAVSPGDCIKRKISGMLQSERVRNFEGRAEQSGFNKRGDSKALKFKNQGSMASLNIVNSSVSLL